MKQRNPRERLDHAIPRYAAAAGVPEARLRTWLSFVAIAGALQHAVDDEIILSYQIKGGVALELRFPTRARATRDLDVGIPGTRAERLERFAQALALGFDGFSFRVKRELDMERADTIRTQVVISYEGRGHQTIDVDVGPADADNIDDVALTIEVIQLLGIAAPSTLRCISIPVQIAQKIHASTHPGIVTDPAQDRARDIIDVLMLDTPVTVPDYSVAWRATLERLAADVGLPHRTAEEIISAYAGILARLAA